MKTKKILAIDPGSEQSAFMLCLGNEPLSLGIVPNIELLYKLEHREEFFPDTEILLIEKVEGYGMPVGKTVFETVFWSGRFVQAWNGGFKQIPRRDIKLHFCGSPRGKDSNIRQCLIDRFGSPGTKKNPNPITYHIKKDLWQTFALIIFYLETLKLEKT